MRRILLRALGGVGGVGTAPAGLLETVLEFRVFSEAKLVVDRAKTKKDIPVTPMTQLVQEIEFALAQGEVDAQSAADD